MSMMDSPQPRSDTQGAQGEGSVPNDSVRDAAERDASNNAACVPTPPSDDASSSAAGAMKKDKRLPPASVDDASPRATAKRRRADKRRKRREVCIAGDDDANVDRPVLGATTSVDDLSAVDASAYLAWVSRQADALPDVFVADGATAEDEKEEKEGDLATMGERREEEPIDGSAAALRALLSERMVVLPPPSTAHLPPGSSDDGKDGNKNCWVSATVANFSRLRSYLERERAIRGRTRPEDRRFAVPRMKDRAAWHVFCLGKEEAYGNAKGYYDEELEEEEEEVGKDDEEENANVDPSSRPSDPTQFQTADVPAAGRPPNTSLLLQLDQVLVRTLLHHHAHYLCEWKFSLTAARCAWIYALLASLEKPWHREECCAVRSVLRECCERRGREDPGSDDVLFSGGGGSAVAAGEGVEAHRAGRERLALLNVLIAVMGIYYEQGAFAGGDGMDSLFTVPAGPR